LTGFSAEGAAVVVWCFDVLVLEADVCVASFGLEEDEVSLGLELVLAFALVVDAGKNLESGVMLPDWESGSTTYTG